MVRKKTNSSHSPSSSIDSSNHPLSFSCTRSESSSCSSSSSPSSSSSFCHSSNSKTKRRDLSTDLRLGLSISPSISPKHNPSGSPPPREQRFDWPPIKPLLRSALAGKLVVNQHCPQRPSYFVKVYMEGVPIGRKLDLFAHDSYDDLVSSLSQMFGTPIQRPNGSRSHCHETLVLTYEDKEGDWMMVGDVPWEMFVITVKRLKITRADRC